MGRSYPDVTGFILAGGQSRRFGSDKALALYRGRALLEWAAAPLIELGIPVAVVAPQASRYANLIAAGLDGERPGLGPVEGVRVAMEACSTEWAIVHSVDMPLMRPVVLEALLCLRGGPSPPQAACLSDSAGRIHPLPCLFHRSAARVLRRSQGGSLLRLLRVLETRVVGSPVAEADLDLDRALTNVNEPGELPPSD